MAGTLRLQNVLDLTQRALDAGVAGDFAELGVWRGGCCILMRSVIAANGDTNRKVYVMDSFEGLPPPRPEESSRTRTCTVTSSRNWRSQSSR